MKTDETIISEAPIGPSRISVRITISEEEGGILVTLDVSDRGKLHNVRQRHTFTVPDLTPLENAAKELASNYATRTSKTPQRIQHLGPLRKWLLGIREWTVLSEIMVDAVAAVTFYRVQTKYGEQILLAFYRQRYQLVPVDFVEEFTKTFSLMRNVETVERPQAPEADRRQWAQNARRLAIAA